MHRHAALAEMVGLFARLDETSPIAFAVFKPVLNNGERCRCLLLEPPGGFFEMKNLVLPEEPLITLFGNERQRFVEWKFLRERQSKSDEQISRIGRRILGDHLPNQLWRLFAHRLAALAAMKL